MGKTRAAAVFSGKKSRVSCIEEQTVFEGKIAEFFSVLIARFSSLLLFHLFSRESMDSKRTVSNMIGISKSSGVRPKVSVKHQIKVSNPPIVKHSGGKL